MFFKLLFNTNVYTVIFVSWFFFAFLHIQTKFAKKGLSIQKHYERKGKLFSD